MLFFLLDVTFSVSYWVIKNTIVLPYTIYTYFNSPNKITIKHLQEDIAFTQYELQQLRLRLLHKEKSDYDDYDIIYSSYQPLA